MRSLRRPTFFVALVLWCSANHALAGGKGHLIVYGEPPQAPLDPGAFAREHRNVRLAGPLVSRYTVNPAHREESRLFFNTVYAASEDAVSGWNGVVTNCAAGATSATFQDTVVRRVNYFRAMAGLAAGITLDPAWSLKDQRAALMMSANTNLDHYPAPDRICYSADGAEAARNSNLALVESGPDAVSGYIHDHGLDNAPVGHRRWILYPQTRVMGTGDIPQSSAQYGANALWVLDGHFFDPRPATRDHFVSWPPPGFVPYQVVYPRWSFSFPEADFSAATVEMTSNGVALSVSLEPVVDGYAENTLVWYPSAMNPLEPTPWPRPTADTPYTISIANVSVKGVARSFTYTVTVFDPQTPGADTVLPALAGSDTPAVNQGNLYTIAPMPNATSYQWLSARRAALTVTETAENGLGGFIAHTTPGYTNVVTLAGASGRFYRLAQPEPYDQNLTYQRVLLPAVTSQVQFRSRLTYATSNQVAKVQVSLDDGLNWTDIYSQAGTDNQGETAFTTRTLSLAPFAGRIARLRFNYVFGGGLRYDQTTPGVGWYFDDVRILNAEELTDLAIASTESPPQFSFTPPQAGSNVLAARAAYYDGLYGEWGPVKGVQARAYAAPGVIIVGAPALANGKVTLEFTVTNYRLGLPLQLLQAAGLGGPWQVQTEAVLETVQVDSRFRLTAPRATPGPVFLRVRAN